MPFPSEHACRIKQPGLFKRGSIRRVERVHDGKKYGVLRGRLKSNDKWEDQAFRYPKRTWTAREARAHCKDHDGILFEPASGAAAYSSARYLTDLEQRMRIMELTGPSGPQSRIGAG